MQTIFYLTYSISYNRNKKKIPLLLPFCAVKRQKKSRFSTYVFCSLENENFQCILETGSKNISEIKRYILWLEKSNVWYHMKNGSVANFILRKKNKALCWLIAKYNNKTDVLICQTDVSYNNHTTHKINQSEAF